MAASQTLIISRRPKELLRRRNPYFPFSLLPWKELSAPRPSPPTGLSREERRQFGWKTLRFNLSWKEEEEKP